MSVKKNTIIITVSLVISLGIILLAVFSTISPRKNSFSIIDPARDRPYLSVYAHMPQGFVHSGRILLFQASNQTSIRSLAETALSYTSFYKSSRLEQAIKSVNHINRDSLVPGQTVLIPHSLPSLLPDSRNKIKTAIPFTRGLYYTGSRAGSESLLEKLPEFVDAGINTIVFDAKDITGIVNYPSKVPDAVELGMCEKKSIDDIDKLIRAFKSNGIYTIARLAVFRDHLLVKKKPEWAIHSKRTGGVWNDRDNEMWCDPTNRDVQDYNLALAIELANKGVDEIQFDYIRFPTAGEIGDARFAWSFGRMENDKSIEHFLQRSYRELSNHNVNFSIDVFGIVAWGHEKDIMKTGQRIELLSRYCDVISPMLYPSHFDNNFDGYAHPGDEPYYFINAGCMKFKASSSKALIRPWLQAFGWKVSNYNSNYIIEQVRASNDANARGYLFWNAANDYKTVLRALKEMRTIKTHSSEVTQAESAQTKEVL